MIRKLFCMLFALGACSHNTPPTSTERPVLSIALPPSVLGVWSPYGEGFWEFGPLEITANDFSWGECRRSPYRVLDARDDAFYLELKRSPPCEFRVPEPFVVLVPKSNEKALEVSLCRERAEFDKAPKRRYCSRGILYRKN